MRGVYTVLLVPVLRDYLRDLEFEFTLGPLANEYDLTFESRVLIVPVKVKSNVEV